MCQVVEGAVRQAAAWASHVRPGRRRGGAAQEEAALAEVRLGWADSLLMRQAEVRA